MSKLIDINKPIQTRDGKTVEIISDKGRGEYPLVGYIANNLKTLDTWMLDGTFSKAGYLPENNLVNVKEKTIVPLDAGDIKPTYLFKRKGVDEVKWLTVTALHYGNVFLAGQHAGISFKSLRDNYLISRDSGETWENCEKEIEE